jgi:hypothetical protein
VSRAELVSGLTYPQVIFFKHLYSEKKSGESIASDTQKAGYSLIHKSSLILFVSIGVLITASFQALGQVEPRLMKCVQIQADSERLRCYDALANEIAEAGAIPGQSQEVMSYIEPPQEFLDSQLRVNPAKSDFDLTINQFLRLIKSAKMENGQPVVINGWSLQEQGYVLNIKMKAPIHLKFVFDPDKNTEYSVLQPVLMKGVKIDPALFVMNMAARTM